MKRSLEEAVELFRENEVLAAAGAGDKEKLNLYRGLRLLAEGIRRLEREIAEVETEHQDGPSNFYQRRRTRVIRKEGRVVPAVPSQ